MKTLTSADAQNHFGQLLDSAQREPVVITRRGRPVAFVVSPEDMQDMMSGARLRSNAAAAYDAYLQQIKGLVTPEAAELTDEAVNALVDAVR